jgi:hypothetical protein
MRKPLGCFSMTGLLALALILAAVGAALLLNGGEMFSPGGLSARSGDALGGVTSHAALQGNCPACHTAPWSQVSMAARCVTCHADVSRQLAEQTGLHGALLGSSPSTEQECRTCHTEHHGADGTLTSADLSDFPHQRLGFSLQAHQRTADGAAFTCQGCHSAATYQFDQSTCVACHRSYQADFITAHLADFGQDCLSCHDGIDTYGRSFDHNKLRFALLGKHASLRCGQCHAGAVQLADLQTTPTACFNCHQKDDRHAGSFGTDCGACHNPEAWSQVTFDHSQTSFPLTGAHLQVKCQACHQNNNFTSLSTECASCHTEPAYHLGLFNTTCQSCHTTRAWLPAQFNLAHNFPLNHGDADSCRSCHPTALSQYVCTGCHNGRDFDREHAGRGDITNCIRCHPNGEKGDD